MEYFVSPFVLSEVLFSRCEQKVMTGEVMAGLGAYQILVFFRTTVKSHRREQRGGLYFKTH